jgi:hypothetical protein
MTLWRRFRTRDQLHSCFAVLMFRRGLRDPVRAWRLGLPTSLFLRTQHTEPQHRKPEDEFFQNQMWPFCLSSCSIHGGQRGDCLFVLFPGAYTLV